MREKEQNKMNIKIQNIYEISTMIHEHVNKQIEFKRQISVAFHFGCCYCLVRMSSLFQ